MNIDKVKSSKDPFHLNYQGQEALLSGKSDEALRFFEDSMNCGDTVNIITSHANICDVHLSKGDIKKAGAIASSGFLLSKVVGQPLPLDMEVFGSGIEDEICKRFWSALGKLINRMSLVERAQHDLTGGEDRDSLAMAIQGNEFSLAIFESMGHQYRYKVRNDLFSDLLERGNLEDASKVLESTNGDSESDCETIKNKAKAYSLQKNTDAALAAYISALEISQSPRDKASVLVEMISILIEAGRCDEAGLYINDFQSCVGSLFILDLNRYKKQLNIIGTYVHR